jgi:hypothetical protein
MNPATAAFYSVRLDTAATNVINCADAPAGQCIDSIQLAKRMVRKFFE